MKKWISLLCFMSLLAFCSCQDDEEEIVFPPSTAEQIADKILSYGTNTIFALYESNSYWDEIEFEIEIPFILLKWEWGAEYRLLENIESISYDSNRLYIRFKE